MNRAAFAALLAATVVGAAAITALVLWPRPVPQAAARTGSYPNPPPPPDAIPRQANFVTAIVVAGGRTWAGSESGLVRLDPGTGAYEILTGTADAPLSGVTDLAVGPDGTLWSAHHRAAPPEEAQAATPSPESGAPAMPPASRGEGGVRALAPDGTVRAWFAADGLGSDDVWCIAAGPQRIMAGVGRAALALDPAASPARFEPRFGDDSRRVLLVDPTEEGGTARSVQEFRPRGEEVLGLAASGASFHLGTTHGLYRIDPGGLVHVLVPCRDQHQVPSRVLAVAATPLPAGAPYGGVVASLAVASRDGRTWRPGGMLEIGPDLAYSCHQAAEDVPASPALDVAVEGGVTWLATYAGLTRIEGRDAVLLDRDEGAPDLPVTAVCGDGAGGCWMGTWGGGVWHLTGRAWTLYRFDAREGVAVQATGRIR